MEHNSLGILFFKGVSYEIRIDKVCTCFILCTEGNGRIFGIKVKILLVIFKVAEHSSVLLIMTIEDDIRGNVLLAYSTAIVHKYCSALILLVIIGMGEVILVIFGILNNRLIQVAAFKLDEAYYLIAYVFVIRHNINIMLLFFLFGRGNGNDIALAVDSCFCGSCYNTFYFFQILDGFIGLNKCTYKHNTCTDKNYHSDNENYFSDYFKHAVALPREN